MPLYKELLKTEEQTMQEPNIIMGKRQKEKIHTHTHTHMLPSSIYREDQGVVIPQ